MNVTAITVSKQKQHQTMTQLNQRKLVNGINGMSTSMQWGTELAFLALQSFSKHSL